MAIGFGRPINDWSGDHEEFHRRCGGCGWKKSKPPVVGASIVDVACCGRDHSNEAGPPSQSPVVHSKPVSFA